MINQKTIFFIEKNIHGAWVIYGLEGVKQYYGYNKSEAEDRYNRESKTIVAR